MFKKIIVCLISLLLILNSALANATTVGAWTLSNPMAVGASILYDGSKGSVTSSVLITPNASQVAKVLRGGIAGYALTLAVEQLLGAVDWVLDPANNQIRYKPTENCILDGTCDTDKIWRTNSSGGTDSISPYSSCQLYAKGWAGTTYGLEYTKLTKIHDNNYLCSIRYFPITACSSCYVNQTFNILTIGINPNYQEKTLPLETVAQKVIENAENNNLDAQFAVLAAANNILSEAEQDVAKAEPIENELEKNAKKPPCITVSGKVVAVGTYGYRHDKVPPSKPHYPFTGDHYNLYKANQNPNNGKCFWVESGAADASNGQLPPPNSIPIEPFI